MKQSIYTIGHSTHRQEHFAQMLHQNAIKMLVDVRSFPGSRRYPHFHKEAMEQWLQDEGIEYMHLPALGGRRRKVEVSANNRGWKNISFKNYADYTTEKTFEAGLEKLISLADGRRLAYMCAERHPSKCHRTILSDHLTSRGIQVYHILPQGSGTAIQLHQLGRWGAVPQAEGGKVSYPERSGSVESEN